MAVFPAFLEPLSEGARHPEQGMNAEKGKGADQKAGHGPKRIIQVWILVPVMMGGMGQVTGKLPVGTRMTFFAGFHDIAAIQTCLAVIGRQDVMGTVTIGTLGCFLTTGKH